MDQLLVWIKESLNELSAHKLSADHMLGVAPSFDFRLGLMPDGALQIQIWWTKVQSRFASEMLWDYCKFHDQTAIADGSIVSLLQGFAKDGKVVQGVRAITVEEHTSPMFDYHPQRFRTSHPLGKSIANLGATSAAGGFTMEVMQAAMNQYMAAQDQYFPKTRLRERIKINGRRESDLNNLFCFYAEFHHYGKQIFDFPKNMVELFKRTDVDGIPLDSIQMPHNTFYMHFGAQPDLVIEGGWAPDGAYVAMIGAEEHRHLQFCLTFAPIDKSQYGLVFENPEPCYTQAIGTSKLKIGVGEAVDLVLSEKMAELRKQAASGTPGVDLAIKEMASAPEQAGVSIVDSTKRFASEEIGRVETLHHVWQVMLRLVVNGLAYLSAYPEDSVNEIPKSAPWALISELDKGSHKAKQRARSKLAEMGYSALNFCGVSFRNQQQSLSDKTGENLAEEAANFTWVRGHWRRQPHGPNRSLRRLQWTMPHRRALAEGSKDAEHGHVYLVA